LKNELKTHKLLLDTMPLIKLFAKEEGWELVQKILEHIENGEIDAAISVVTLTEVYYKYLNEKRPDLAAARIEELKYASAVKKIAIDEKIAVKAGEFKGNYSIPIADAFISATAYFNKSIVLSNDKDFKKVKEIKVLNEKEYLSEFEHSIEE
jgi:predicted nucleic acid-binding protein